jgi:GNAT superfamily N-acetyltransferase
MTLGVLAPYRQQGLATKLLNQVISAAQKTHQSVASTSQTNGEGITKSTSTTTTTTTLTTSSSAAIESSSSKKSAQKGKKSTVKKTAETGEVGANLVVGTTTTTTRAQGENEEEPSSVRVPLISSAYVHVQFGNEEAKQFYRNRGFSLDGEVSEYYRKIEPRGAWILVKQVAA